MTIKNNILLISIMDRNITLIDYMNNKKICGEISYDEYNEYLNCYNFEIFKNIYIEYEIILTKMEFEISIISKLHEKYKIKNYNYVACENCGA